MNDLARAIAAAPAASIPSSLFGLPDQKPHERVLLAADAETPGAADRLLVCRMAADGFWFSQMLDVYALDDAHRARILALLLQLCGPKED